MLSFSRNAFQWKALRAIPLKNSSFPNNSRAFFDDIEVLFS